MVGARNARLAAAALDIAADLPQEFDSLPLRCESGRHKFAGGLNMSKIFKVGVVGTGAISRAHMPGWAASPHAEVVAGSDLNAEALSAWGHAFGVTRLAADPAEIINDPDIDIVDVCTPNRHHAPLVIAALEAGKHVMCEKPLAPTPAEIEAIIAASEKTGNQVMTGQHFRFTGSAQAMKAEIDAGALGEIYHARGWMMRRNLYIASPTFVHKAHSGGGACIDIGVHILDLTLWMMGNPKPVSVSGTARTELAKQPGQFSRLRGDIPTPPDWDVEEFANAFVRFDNGATLMLEVSWLLHHDTEGEDMQMWLYGKDGGGHWPSTQFLSTNRTTKQQYNRTLQITADTMEPHAAECMAFAQALADNAPSPVPPQQSLQVLSILDGIYRSQEAGAEIRL